MKSEILTRKVIQNRINCHSAKILCFLYAISICICQNSAFSQNPSSLDKKTMLPKVITFNPDSSRYQALLNDEKDSVVFNSGFVTLAPNKSGDLHNTGNYEEMIIPLEGQGQLQIPYYKNLDLRFGKVALVPPHTEHHMANTGTKNFKYIYIAVKTQDK